MLETVSELDIKDKLFTITGEMSSVFGTMRRWDRYYTLLCVNSTRTRDRVDNPERRGFKAHARGRTRRALILDADGLSLCVSYVE